MPISSLLVRWGGLAAVGAGALLVVSVLLSSLGQADPSTFLGALASVLSLGGLVGLHARQAGEYGRLGAAGFLLAFAGTLIGAAAGPLLVLGDAPTEGPPPTVLKVLGILYLAGPLGLLLMGVATLRARVLALPWRMLPLAIFAVTLLSPFLTHLAVIAGFEGGGFWLVSTTLAVLVGLGWMLLGYALWSGPGEGFRRPATVT